MPAGRLRPHRDGQVREAQPLGTGSLVILFPRLVILGLRTFESRVGHHIPCVADANEQEQHRYRSDDKQGRYRLTRKQNRRDEEERVGDERQDRIP